MKFWWETPKAFWKSPFLRKVFLTAKGPRSGHIPNLNFYMNDIGDWWLCKFVPLNLLRMTVQNPFLRQKKFDMISFFGFHIKRSSHGGDLNTGNCLFASLILRSHDLSNRFAQKRAREQTTDKVQTLTSEKLRSNNAPPKHQRIDVDTTVSRQKNAGRLFQIKYTIFFSILLDYHVPFCQTTAPAILLSISFQVVTQTHPQLFKRKSAAKSKL